MENDKSVLRWGGLAGMMAFAVWILEMPVYSYVDPFVEGGLARFPEIRTVLALSTVLCMTTALLSIAFVLILYRVLRETNRTLASLGAVLSVIGLIGVALSDASTFYAFDPLSKLYHSPAATAEARATVELLWESTQGVTYTFTFVGSLFLMAGFIALGAAMRGSPAFGRRLGWTGVALGVIGGLGAVLSLLVFEAMGIMFISDLVFLLLVGRRLHSLSKEPDPPIA